IRVGTTHDEMGEFMANSNCVLVAMSGGIDSSVAAYLLKEQGFQVTGIYFHLIDDRDSSELSEAFNDYLSNKQKLKSVAQKLSIPLLEADYKKDFFKIIILDFIEKYKKGLTPNPCIFCNEKIKFQLLYNFALKEKIKYISTGHYVRVEKEEAMGRYILKRGTDVKKDQSYFLYRLKQAVLSKCSSPLGDLKKEDTRKIAQKIGLPNSIAHESQEICFIPENNYRKLISSLEKTKEESGYFLDSNGNILGRHKGISCYTIGQRKKTGLSLNSRKYVTKIIPENNTVIMGDEHELYHQEFEVTDVHYPSCDSISQPAKLLVQIRYNTPPAMATVFPLDEGKLKIIFDKPQRAITPGQSAVFYQADMVIGGGIIEQF
ncbi:MAG TPA: tRNA 2-thiouridine(34) synthase MnmA, partial [Atribacterota bacterium]|nr:tRNA 2-thiouridine(34) synthase MnmA [Atribacterota bacterium]